MLRINECTSGRAAKTYYTQALAQGDYYMDAHELPGEWGGRSAHALGLSGPVDRERYFQLCDNLRPDTGNQLTPKTRADRRVGYDFTFSAPKSVSLAYELTGDERIRDAFTAAIRATMAEMESEMKTRVRRNGAQEDRVTGNLVWGEFTHLTTRPIDGKPDPHLHMHVFVFNATFDPKERRWKAGQFGDLKRDAGYFEAAYHARLAEELRAIGYATEKDDRYSFRLTGLDRTITDRFSRRTAEVDAKAAALEAAGVQLTAKQRGALGEKTRRRKSKDQTVTRDELRAEWRDRLSPSELRTIADLRSDRDLNTPNLANAEASVRYAIDHCFERDSTVPQKRMKETALRHGAGTVRHSDIERLAANGELITVSVAGERVSTTRAICAEERTMLDAARRGHGKFAPLANDKQSLSDLDRDQLRAVNHVLSSRDFVTGVRGGAGTGKTHLMRSTISAIEAEGLKVHVFAPTAQASRGVLRKEGFEGAETVAKLLSDASAQSALRGQVMWIDEAGLLGSRDMKQLITLAEQQKCRVVLSGDYRQHGSVGRGDASLRLLETDAGVRFAQLTKIRRQKPDNYRAAVEAISRQNVAEGFSRLDAMGAVTQIRGEKRLAAAAADYLTARETNIDALVIAPTRKEGARLTGLIRTGLRNRGHLNADERGISALESTDWTEAERGDKIRYEAGQIVQFGARTGVFRTGERATVCESNSSDSVMVARADGSVSALPLKQSAAFQVYRPRELALAEGDMVRITRNGSAKRQQSESGTKRGSLNNGATFTVRGFTNDGDIRLSNGMVLAKNYGHLEHGYVDTSYKSQGKTCSRVILVAGRESYRAANREQFYVSVSRGRDSAAIYTDDKTRLLDSVKRSSLGLSATELLQSKPYRPRGVRQLFGQLVERTRLARWMQRRRDIASVRPATSIQSEHVSYGR